MGTAVFSDPISDQTRFHPTMVMGEALQTSSRRSESTRNLSGLAQTSRLPNSVSTQARIPSAASTPTQPNFPTSRPRSASHHGQPTAPTAIPPRVNAHQHPLETAQIHYPPPIREGEAPHGYDRNGFPLTSNPQGLASTPPSPRLQPTQRSMLSFAGSEASSPSRIKVRDLSHIQSFASEEVLTRSRHGSKHSLRGKQELGQQYEISSMPVMDIIEMVAGLLTKITTTNDQQHEHIHRHIPPPEGSNGLSQQSSSVLAFHGKNVPSITILSYLSRIHKYCPTTYEVFLSLLVYFDRMTEMVNSGSLRSIRDAQALSRSEDSASSPDTGSAGSSTMVATPPSSYEEYAEEMKSSPASPPSGPSAHEDAYNLSHFFVVDSFNIHRLVIAGVTCASKFFSDVFYTNSRYAKVSCLLLPLFPLPKVGADLAHLLGRRSPSCRAQPSGVAIPPLKRLPPFGTCGGIRSVRDNACGILCSGGHGTADCNRTRSFVHANAYATLMPFLSVAQSNTNEINSYSAAVFTSIFLARACGMTRLLVPGVPSNSNVPFLVEGLAFLAKHRLANTHSCDRT